MRKLKNLPSHCLTLVLAALTGLLGSCSTIPHECFVEIKARDDKGRLMPIELLSVRRFGDSAQRNLLEMGPPAKREAIWQSPRLFIASKFEAYEVSLRDESGKTHNVTVLHGDCRDGSSLHLGSAAAPTTTTRKGRLTGCKIDESWWIRAMPLAGHQDDEFPLDAYINTADGSFVFQPVPQRGVLLLFIGKHVKLLKAVTANTGENLGDINMQGACE